MGGTPYDQNLPGPQPGPYAANPPLMAPRPVRTSLAGPVTMTSIGAVLLVATIVVAVFVVRTFVSIVPLGVLDAGGDPGSSSLASTPAPGSTTARLDPGYYHLYLVVPVSEQYGTLDGDALLTGTDGTAITAEPSAVNGSASMGGSRAFTVAGFRVEQGGEYTLTVPVASSDDAQVVLVEGHDVAGFFAGVLGTVGGVFVSIGLGAIGFGLTGGGGVGGDVRGRARRRVAAGPQPAG